MNDKELFILLQNFLDEMNATNSLNDKKEIISRYECLKELFNFVYNPYKKYYIKSEQLKKHSDLCFDSYINDSTSLFELLHVLHTRKITGYEAIENINYFIFRYKENEQLIKLIIDKDLKCGMGSRLINKVFPDTVLEFKVALADRYKSDMAKKMDWVKWGAMRKLDGVRCTIHIDNNSNAKFYSRTGHEFNTLGVVAKEIKELGIKNLVLDGEVCIVDEYGMENFQSIMKVIKKKNYTISNPKFIIFDILTPTEFYEGHGEVRFIDRIKRHICATDLYNSLGAVSIIGLYTLQNETQFNNLISKAISDGWEGLMLRRSDSPYKAKRTKDLLKVKQFQDAEYKVIGIETGYMRVINPDTKVPEEIEVMTNVLINHNDSRNPDNIYQVSVGSGFKLNERKYYYKHSDEIIGKEITVQYFGESRNQMGMVSLRFPTVKKIWTEGKRDV